jgi:hypothetical protein
VIHPELFESASQAFVKEAIVKEINSIGKGSMPWTWYLSLPFRAALEKLLRGAALVRSGEISE